VTKKTAKRNVIVSRPSKSHQAVAREREEARAQQQSQQNRIIAAVAGVLAIIVVGVLAWQVIVANRAEAPATTTGATGAITNGSIIESDRPLAALEPVERNGFYGEYPPLVIDPGKAYEAVIRTEKGDMRLRLFADQAPLTVNNFVFLATEGFYDDTIFHRVLSDFMAQAGDPTGTGTGGPGYQFADETDTGLSFDRRGLLAMANAGPATNGSQFFITFVPTPHLDGRHTIFGELIDGDNVLSQITLRDPSQPNAPADTILRIDIVEGD
jgi:cyclophilin family peptidyl-prolyl cis-trans isomerase